MRLDERIGLRRLACVYEAYGKNIMEQLLKIKPESMIRFKLE
jgi:hypothetical protein